jgi:alcohol dehydrogenase class IV
MLPHFVTMMEQRAPEQIGALAAALGASDGASPGVRVGELAARSGVTRLAELGVSPAALPTVVEAALQHPAIGSTPGGVDEAMLNRVLEEAF